MFFSTVIFLMGATTPTSPSATGGIDASIIVAIIALVSTVSGVIIANRYTSRAAREAAAKSVIVEQSKLDEQRRQYLMDNMQEEITRITEMRRQDRDDYDRRISEMNTRMTAISDQHDQYRRERSFLQQQVDSLVLWSRAVVRVMRGANITYPPPPQGVDTDPDGFEPLRGKH
jgi:septal ring factor EnvC (AmiA/AmiB activator)